MFRVMARTIKTGAVLATVAVVFTAVAVAAMPKAGGTYTNRGKGLQGTLRVANAGTSIKKMSLEFPIPYCVNGGWSRFTRIPATDIKIRKSGTFTVSGTVANGGQDDPSAPAKTTISGKFTAGGRRADVAIKMIIRYPAGHKGCSTQTVENHGTFVQQGS